MAQEMTQELQTFKTRPQLIAPSEAGSAVRRAIDPDGTLPAVSFVAQASPASDELRSYCNAPILRYDIRVPSSVAGYAYISGCRAVWRNGYHFAGIGLNREYLERPGGVGIAAYVLAIETAHHGGFPFMTDHKLSPAATRMWERFVAAGVAEVIDPFVLEIKSFSHTWDTTTRFVGDVRVNPQ
jgi:hypothetical protein